MSKRKKIAVIACSILSKSQEKTILGIQQEAFAADCDVLIFSTLINGQDWNDFLEGEKNIYTLANLDKIDGIIFIPDRLPEYEQTKFIMEEIKEKVKCPIVSINLEMGVAANISASAPNPMYSILEHLVEEHKVEDIAFMTGKEGHPHTHDRLHSFETFMKERNLPIKENRRFFGDFWYDKGDEVVEKLVHCPEGLPQAICCASESMALSVLEACQKRNIKVPTELIVTGFDADNGGVVEPYYLTSVILKEDIAGRNAMRALLTQMDGVERPLEKMEDQVYIGYSCGCREIKKELGFDVDLSDRAIEEYQGFFSEFNFMIEDGISAENMDDCIWKIDWYTIHLKKYAGFYLCLCDDWLGYDREDKLFRSKDYSDSMNLVYQRHNVEGEEADKSIDYRRQFPKTVMLPDIWEERDTPSTYLFTPIHFQTRCLGYMVLQYDKPTVPPDYYWRWTRNVCAILETMRRYIKMEKVNEELTEAYRQMERDAVIDSLTGIYNRNAYNIFSREQMHLAISQDKDILILVGDLNNLKMINDNYGHSEGDFALKQCANAISRFQETEGTKYERSYRMGGDEYTVICIGKFTKEDIQARLKKVEDYVHQVNEISDKPYVVSVSLGVYFGGAVEKDMDKLQLIADQKMYEAKRRSKKDREIGLKDVYLYEEDFGA